MEGCIIPKGFMNIKYFETYPKHKDEKTIPTHFFPCGGDPSVMGAFCSLATLDDGGP